MLNQPLILVGIFFMFPDSTQAQHIFPGGNFIYHNSNQGLHFGNFVSVDKKRLAVSPIHKSRVTTTSMCLLSCLNNFECVSFNFGISAEQGTHLCELLNTDKHESAGNWREDAEFRHYSPKTYCDTMPCQNQGRCIPNYATDEYTCECPLHAEGEHCEILKEITMNITCDNQCTVYANGQTLGQTTTDWPKIVRFSIPGVTKTIALAVQNLGGPTATLASISNGKMTDASWRCTSVYTPGWNSAEFDASQWPYAVEHAAHNNAPWDKVINGISLNAKWIGVAETDVASFFCVLKL